MKFPFLHHQKICEQTPWLYLKVSAISGKGVFSSKKFKRGEMIETCPVIVFHDNDVERVRNTVLYWYYFTTSNTPPALALALGYGSVYNHQCPANATFSFSTKKQVLLIKACSDIAAHTEITINYNGSPTDPSLVSFPANGIIHP